MSLINQLKSLLEIQNQKNIIDQKIIDLREQVKQNLVGIEKIARLTTHEQINLHDIQKSVDLSQLDVELIRAEEKTRREQLERERNGETIRLLSITVGKLERTRINAENALEALWHEMEKVKNNLTKIQAQSAIRIKDFESNILQLENSIQAERIKFAEVTLQATSILNALPAEIKTQLESMIKTSAQNPISPVVQNLCGACFYPLSSRDLTVLMQKNLETVLPCQNCFTILYVEPGAPG